MFRNSSNKSPASSLPTGESPLQKFRTRSKPDVKCKCRQWFVPQSWTAATAPPYESLRMLQPLFCISTLTRWPPFETASTRSPRPPRFELSPLASPPQPRTLRLRICQPRFRRRLFRSNRASHIRSTAIFSLLALRHVPRHPIHMPSQRPQSAFPMLCFRADTQLCSRFTCSRSHTASKLLWYSAPAIHRAPRFRPFASNIIRRSKRRAIIHHRSPAQTFPAKIPTL